MTMIEEDATPTFKEYSAAAQAAWWQQLEDPRTGIDAFNVVGGEEHNALASKIRLAILLAVEPSLEVVIEDKLFGENGLSFRVALAEVVAELLGWDQHGGAYKHFMEDVRFWVEDEPKHFG